MLTNNHVLSCEEDAEGAHAFFMDFMEQETVQVELDPTRFWATSDRDELDFTFCVLKGSFPRLRNARRTPMPLKLSYRVPKVNDTVIIVQFPRGGQRKHAVQRISETEGDFTYYLCDTDYGSSGSPVMCGEEVVALHHQRSTIKKANKGVVMGKVMRRLLQIMRQRSAQVKYRKAAPAARRPSAASYSGGEVSAASNKYSGGEVSGQMLAWLLTGATGSSQSGKLAEMPSEAEAMMPSEGSSLEAIADFLHNDGLWGKTGDELVAKLAAATMSPITKFDK